MKQNNLSRNPHKTLALGLGVVLVMSLLFDCDAIDIQMNSAYIVTAPFHLAMIFSAPLAIMAAIYWWAIRAKKQLTNWLTMGHIAFSLFSVLTIIFILCEKESNLVGNPYDVVRYCLWAFTVGQVMFFVNLGVAFFKK